MSIPASAPDVVQVSVLGGHRLLVRLQDGTRGVFDVAPWLDVPAYAALREPGYFGRVHVAYGVLCWPNEEDFAPETVADRLVPFGGEGERLLP